MEETTFVEIFGRCLQLWVFSQSKTIHFNSDSWQVAFFAFFFNSLFPGFLQGNYEAWLISAVCFFMGKGGKRWEMLGEKSSIEEKEVYSFYT